MKKNNSHDELFRHSISDGGSQRKVKDEGIKTYNVAPDAAEVQSAGDSASISTELKKETQNVTEKNGKKKAGRYFKREKRISHWGRRSRAKAGSGIPIDGEGLQETQIDTAAYRMSQKKLSHFSKKKKASAGLHRKKRSSSNSNVALIALMSLFGCVFLASGVMLTKTLLQYKKANDEYKDISASAVVRPMSSDTAEKLYLSVDYAALEARNEDYMGWIDIPETAISYPVVRAADYVEYLYTGFDRVYNGSGCIFADYQCANDFTGRSTILYGHRMNDGSMFGTLKEYFEPDFLEKHKEIHIYVNGEVLVYKVFSVYQAVAADESYRVDFDSDDEYKAWLDGVKAKSVIDTGISVNEDDRVLMLSTCKGGDNNYRTVVFAALKKTIDI